MLRSAGTNIKVQQEPTPLFALNFCMQKAAVSSSVAPAAFGGNF
jgi:hypothetical protein